MAFVQGNTYIYISPYTGHHIKVSYRGTIGDFHCVMMGGLQASIKVGTLFTHDEAYKCKAGPDDTSPL